jgi:O-antigen biosynthesis protein
MTGRTGRAPRGVLRLLPVGARDRLRQRWRRVEVAIRGLPDRLAYPRARRALTPLVPRSAGEPPRVLVLEDRVPHAWLGRGLPRTNLMVRTLVDLGYRVTLYPLRTTWERRRTRLRDVPPDVEIVWHHGFAHVREFLEARRGCYDVVVVCRPHNMAAIRPLLPELNGAAIVYDAESLFSARDAARERLYGSGEPPDSELEAIGEEVGLARGASSIIAVSGSVASHFAPLGIPVHTLSHAVDARPTPRSFHDRKGFLFVGPVPHTWAPNYDALEWFTSEVFPWIQARLGPTARLQVVGQVRRSLVRRWSSPSVELVGATTDLTPSYDRSRVFVAPMRYGAGIPLKVVDAAARGVPVVGTALVAEQLGWRDGDEMLAAADPERFAEQCVRAYEDFEVWRSLRTAALARVEQEWSPARFASKLDGIVREALASR